MIIFLAKFSSKIKFQNSTHEGKKSNFLRYITAEYYTNNFITRIYCKQSQIDKVLCINIRHYITDVIDLLTFFIFMIYDKSNVDM